MTDPEKRLTAQEIVESAWLNNRNERSMMSTDRESSRMRATDYRPMTTPTLSNVGRRITTAPNSIDINILGEMVKLGYHED